MKIGIVATGRRLLPEVPEKISSLIADSYAAQIETVFLSQSSLSWGHFAGTDEDRAQAFIEAANNPSFDVVWFANGGYGTGRVTDMILPFLNEVARRKIYMGYSDAGYLLAALYKNGIGKSFHAPMPRDILRENGVEAVRRCLDFLLTRDKKHLEPSVDGKSPTIAINMTTLDQLIGTPFLPSLTGHIVMLEEVEEHMYRIDRMMCHFAQSGILKGVAGLRLGACENVLPNDIDFGQSEEDIARYWCQRAGIPFVGRATIGHNAANRIVPFGVF